MVKPLESDRVVAGVYRVLRPLGRTPGASVASVASVVHAAEHTVTGRACVLRVFDPAAAVGEARARFDAACRVRATLKTAHVVDLLGAGVDGDTPWMALERLEGETLAAALESTAKRPLPDAEFVLGEVGHALSAVHAAGQVHGALEPSGVFLARRRRHGDDADAVLLDFWSEALARTLPGGDARRSAPPLWLAPELLGGDPGGPQADVWSFGLLAFRVLSGTVYWQSAATRKVTAGAVQREVASGKLVSASERARSLGGATLPAGFDAWFARCVARTEDERFPDAGEASAALDVLWESNATAVQTHAHVRPSLFAGLRRRVGTPDMAVPLGLAAALAVAVGVRAVVRHRRRAHAPPPAVVSTAPAAPRLITGPVDPLPTWQSQSDGQIVYPNNPDPTAPDPAGGRWAMIDATAGMPATGTITAEIETSLGTITCQLMPERAPITVANFMGLARGIRPFWDPMSGRWVRRPFYDGSVFHRILPGMWIQGGDLMRSGVGGTGYTFPDENVSPHDEAGLLLMGNRGPNTNGGQFFILTSPRPLLDGRYSIFGRCGPLDVIHQIEHVPLSGPRPHDPVFIRHVRVHRG